MGLTKKQAVFVEEYLKCWNATQAAQCAGYAYPNKQAPRLLVNVGIAEKIKARIAEKAMSADEILLRLGEQARSDISQFVQITPSGLSIDWDVVKKNGHLVKKIKMGPSGPEIELYDSQNALIQLARTFGLFIDRQELSGRDGGPIAFLPVVATDDVETT